MNILFVSGNPHLPQVVGGVEVNTHELATELLSRGHSVAVAAKLSLRDRFGLSRAAHAAILRKDMTIDCDLGYPVFRARQLGDSVSELPRTSVAVIQNGNMVELAQAFARVGVPSVAYFHGLGFEDWREDGASLPFCGYLAVSQFTAERFRLSYGIDPVVLPPFFRRERYATQVAGRMVTFINPVPVKGLHLALDIAALCPTIRFCFVRAWPLGLGERAKLKRSLSNLPNVELRTRTSDMRAIYADTKILLVPSQLETWGRVVSEAQFSGIPVVASGRGGLPESVGPGGIILGYECAAAEWAAVIRKLWSDKSLYRELAQAALRHAARPSLDPDRQVCALVDALAQFVA